MANFMIMLPFLIFFFLFPPPTTCFSNKTDLLSLLAFKSSLKDPQGALNSWNETLHFCSWKGIQCSHRHRGRVVEINLSSQGLVGSLAPHLGNISFLKYINLQNNSLHGQIPEQIGLLRRLDFVEFSNNSFIGGIPKNLSQCQDLVYLNLIDNKLSGTIPNELSLLYKLKFLLLSKNQFSGPTPPFIGNLTSLTKLSLGSCNFNGEIPDSFAQLQSLTFLQLADNNFAGTIPKGLFNISKLVTLGVDSNELDGAIPSSIGFMMPNLKNLYLADNKFSGPVPASLSNISSMEQLILSLNYFTGEMPEVGGLLHLIDFFIGRNHIDDDASYISSLTNCTNLKRIDVSQNLLKGALPDSISNFSSHLTDLYMHQNQMHGNIPSGIGNLIGLTTVALFDNYLEGPIPVDIAKLSNLQELYAGSNRFTDNLPSSLGNLTLLNLLYLNENNFLGNLPSSLGNCTNLLELDLSHNNFSGVIPPEIMSLSSLSIIFNLSYNYLEDSIPYEVGFLTNLAALDFSNNRLSGSIPNSLSKCMSLQQLYLQGNLLEGEIPSGMSDLMGLQDLDLSRNNLSGLIPSFLGKLDLAKLNLSFNRLHGEVPIIGVFKNKTAICLEGNNQLCGGILELKLPSCSPSKSQKKNLSTLLKILTPILVAGAICLMLCVFFTYKKRMSHKNMTPSVPSFTGNQFIRLSYEDLIKATEGFSRANSLGIGRFGSVYRGVLDDGRTQVAVKVLNLFIQGASKSFLAECNALRNVRHRNLVKILSVCESIDFQGNDFKAVVYDFKANGSLEKWLYNNMEEEQGSGEEIVKLSMIQRLKIAIDIAQALEYLHCGTDSIIVHGDLKPSNILLDHEMTACVGDFGLAKIVSSVIRSHESNSSIGIRGTLGYVPPEYGMSHSVSPQGDVYSYGTVLLEMFTNKRPIDDSFTDHVNLHNFVRAALPSRVMEIVDQQFRTEPEMNNGKIKDCMTLILSIGVSCSKEIPKERMLMTDVVNELHKIQKTLLSS